MSKIHESIDVNVPVRTAYDQWTQFEDFPRFMEGVERVVQLDDTTLEWTAKVAGKEESWRAKITTQEPDREIAWHSTSGAPNGGDVRFESLGMDSTRIDLTMDVEPQGPAESAGDALGFVQRRVKGDLERFKQYIEQRGQATGAWRGEVSGGSTAGRGTSMGSGTGSDYGTARRATGSGEPRTDV
jgi:uncharacterized membrane protein